MQVCLVPWPLSESKVAVEFVLKNMPIIHGSALADQQMLHSTPHKQRVVSLWSDHKLKPMIHGSTFVNQQMLHSTTNRGW